ncbi:MAG: hypothetical protein RLZZ116_164 [Planctomycetota bacterium]|jgi:hypothetical protein
MPASHIDPRPALAATISPLVSSRTCADTRTALEWLGAAGYRGVQLSATDPETRPRELSMSARRDLAATMTRLELACSGIDLFIPPAHFADPAHMARAFEATEAAIEFAAMLGRVPVTVPLAPKDAGDFLSAMTAAAARHGVDVLLPIVEPNELELLSPPFTASVDCAAVLAAGGDPAALACRAQARLGGVRLVDLGRAGLRVPILEPRESRLDALALRIALDTIAFTRSPVVDARQWAEPAQGLAAVLSRWSALGRF